MSIAALVIGRERRVLLIQCNRVAALVKVAHGATAFAARPLAAASAHILRAVGAPLLRNSLATADTPLSPNCSRAPGTVFPGGADELDAGEVVVVERLELLVEEAEFAELGHAVVHGIARRRQHVDHAVVATVLGARDARQRVELAFWQPGVAGCALRLRQRCCSRRGHVTPYAPTTLG